MSSPTIAPPPETVPRQPSPSEDNPLDLILYCSICLHPVPRKDNSGNKQEKLPFWLASCGHILCGDHDFPNCEAEQATKTTHTCPFCTSTGISLVSLESGEVPLDLRDYFRPQLELLDDFAGALKFQYNNLVRIASHYRALSEKLTNKLENQKKVLIKVKDELIEARELKKQAPILKSEIQNLRQEVSELRVQLSILPSEQSRTKPSPAHAAQFAATPGSGSKRKADEIEDTEGPGFSVKQFRRELNERQSMAPPPQPFPAERKKIPTDSRPADDSASHQSSRPKQTRAGTTQQNKPIDFVDLTRDVQYPRSPEYPPLLIPPTEPLQREYRPLPPSQNTPTANFNRLTADSLRPPSNGLMHRRPQEHQVCYPSASYNTLSSGINAPFHPPSQIHRPVDNPGPGLYRYFGPSQIAPSTGYGNRISPQQRISLCPPVSRSDNPPFSTSNRLRITSYEQDIRGGQAITPGKGSISETSVVSPFFSDPSTTLRNSSGGTSNSNSEGKNIARPASVANYFGRRKSEHQAYSRERYTGQLFRREPNGAVSGGGTSRWPASPTLSRGNMFVRGDRNSRPGTVAECRQGEGGGLGDLLGNRLGADPRGNGFIERPGLRRSVRRD